MIDLSVLFKILKEDGGVGGIGGGGISMGGAPVSSSVSGAAPTNHTGSSIALTWAEKKKKKKLEKFIP